MQRARSDAEKAVRKQVFLKVGEDLFTARPDQLPSVAQIVKAAGLAKGTFYLYFDTKEELYLDILSLRFAGWLEAIQAELAAVDTLNSQSLAEMILRPVANDSCFLNLATITQTILEVNLSEKKAITFKKRLGAELSSLADWTQNEKSLPKEFVIALLQDAYAAVIGCWQMSRVSETVAAIRDKVGYDFLFPNFETNAASMLESIISGSLFRLEKDKD